MSLDDKFIESCENGNLMEAKKLYNTGKIDIHTENDYAFGISCARGHIEIAQWLLSLGGGDIHAENDEAFRWSCYRGHLEVAKWLLSLGGINIHANNDYAFRMSCHNGQLDVIKWLLLIDKFDNQLINEKVNFKDKQIYKLIFSQGYFPLNNFMKKKYKIYLKDRAKFLWKIMRILMKTYKWYNKMCLNRYAPDGEGYIDSMNEFSLLAKVD